MPTEDFWLKLYSFAAELHPVSDGQWDAEIVALVEEYNRFPLVTRDALRAHVKLVVVRMTQLHSHLD
jgi:hypothetical protein